MKRLVVLASGQGSNLQALLDAGLPVVAVVSNRPGAYALQRARQAGLPALLKERRGDRRAYDRELADLVHGYAPDWVVLAGWLHILSRDFLDRFPDRVVNLHPALPGAFPGLHAIERAHAAFHRGEIEHTGVMVHLVPDEGVDSGPVLAQEIVAIHPQDTLENLEARVHQVEHRLLTQTLLSLVEPPIPSGKVENNGPRPFVGL